MANKYNNCTSIRFDDEIKPWLYRKMQTENRSLGNLVNTILKKEKEQEEKETKKDSNSSTWAMVFANE